MQVLTRALAGGIKGGALGLSGSLATGAAIVFTTPAWLPFAAGTAVISIGTLATWGCIGTVIVGSVSGAKAYLKYKGEEEAFARAFPPARNHQKEVL